MNFKTFGEWLRHRRLQQDISPFKMSEELGYKRVSAIYNFEYGLAPLPMAKWPAMARVLDVPLEKFLAIMERFSPLKVNEFRAIQEARSASVLSEDKSLSAERVEVQTTPAKEIQGEVLQTYRLEEAEIAVVFQGSCGQDLFGYIDELWNRGQRVGLMNVSGARQFPAAAVVDGLKKVSTIGIFEAESEAESSTAAIVKAAFLDALTGVVDYPHIHRVPKIYSCVFDEPPAYLEAVDIKAFLGMLRRGSDARLIRLAGRPEVRA
jgi:transcriptional regulator with XRE-family HTH domain